MSTNVYPCRRKPDPCPTLPCQRRRHWLRAIQVGTGEFVDLSGAFSTTASPRPGQVTTSGWRARKGCVGSLILTGDCVPSMSKCCDPAVQWSEDGLCWPLVAIGGARKAENDPKARNSLRRSSTPKRPLSGGHRGLVCVCVCVYEDECVCVRPGAADKPPVKALWRQRRRPCLETNRAPQSEGQRSQQVDPWSPEGLLTSLSFAAA